MKINFQTSGGFAHLPALNKPFLIDTAQLDPETAHQLESYVRDSRFFDLPAQVSNAAKGAADYKTYTITVDDGTRIHTLKISEPIKDEQLQKLVSHLGNISRPSTEVKRP